MKQVNVFLLLVILLASCSPQGKIESIPTQTQTLVPSPTNTPTLTPTTTFTPTATLEPSAITFDIGEGVPEQDIQDIQTGIEYIRLYLRDYLDGDSSLAFQKKLKIKIVATGLGDQSPSGGGSCCTFDRTRIFFDVKHHEWNRNTIPVPFRTLSNEHVKSAAHEYIHSWQGSLGCLTNSHPLGHWMDEGTAEYIAEEIAIQQGMVDKGELKKFMYGAAEYTGEIGGPLQSRESGGSDIWPGHIGYLAIDYLVSKAPKGVLSLRIICEQVGTGISVENAFKNAFGISKQDFYKEFQGIYPQYIDDTHPTPGKGIINGKVILDSLDPDQSLDKYNLKICGNNLKCSIIPIQSDGTFGQSLTTGTYTISLNFRDAEALIGWYSITGLVDKGICADTVQIKLNKILLMNLRLSVPVSCT